MSAWRQASLCEVSEVFNGKTPPRGEQRDQGHAVLKIKDVSELGQFRGTFDSFVDRAFAQKFAAATIQAGDTLILNAAHNAAYVGSKTYRVDEATAGALATGEWLIVRPDGAVLDPGFAHRWVNAQGTRRAIRGLVKGIHLYPKDVERLRIPVPALPAQRRVAAILDRADALRAARRAALLQCDRLMEAVFREMFGDPTVNPHEWQRADIGDVCELIIDCVNRTAPLSERPTPFKMIRTSNVKGGFVDLADVRFVTEETFHRWNRRATPRRGDLLLTREAPVGQVGILDSDDAVFLGQRLMLYRPNTERATAEYLRFLFESRFVQRQFDQHGSGSTVKHLALPVCRSLTVLQPPIAMQRQFAIIVRKVLEVRSSACTSLTKLDTLFASLEHRAFEGEL